VCETPSRLGENTLQECKRHAVCKLQQNVVEGSFMAIINAQGKTTFTKLGQDIRIRGQDAK
jgi:hypothetical protein